MSTVISVDPALPLREQLRAFENGPISAFHGVVRWRLVDLYKEGEICRNTSC